MSPTSRSSFAAPSQYLGASTPHRPRRRAWPRFLSSLLVAIILLIDDGTIPPRWSWMSMIVLATALSGWARARARDSRSRRSAAAALAAATATLLSSDEPLPASSLRSFAAALRLSATCSCSLARGLPSVPEARSVDGGSCGPILREVPCWESSLPNDFMEAALGPPRSGVSPVRDRVALGEPFRPPARYFDEALQLPFRTMGGVGSRDMLGEGSGAPLGAASWTMASGSSGSSAKEASPLDAAVAMC